MTPWQKPRVSRLCRGMRHELNAASRSLVGARTIAAKHNLGGRVAALIRNEGLLGGKQAAHLRALVLASLFVNVA